MNPGFYKINEDEGGLHYAPNFVYNAAFGKLTKEKHGKKDMEMVDGWKWFDSEEEACAYFGTPNSPK